jgi:hypothetical protein
MKWRLFTSIAVLLSAHLLPAQSSVVSLLQSALEAQGGEQRLRAVRSVQWEAYGYRNELEESERPEGPYVTDFLYVTEIDDFQHDRFRASTEAKVYPFYETSSTTIIDGTVGMMVQGGDSSPATPEIVELARERIALSPERLLLTAIDSSDVRLEPNMVLQSVNQNVVKFTLDGAPVYIYLNSYTHLPTAVDYSGPLAHTGYWAYLGDVTLRTYFGMWWLAKGGLRLPMQRNLEGNGMAAQMLVIRKLQIDEPVNDSNIAIGADIRAKFDVNAKPRDLEAVPLGSSASSAKEIVPGVVLIPGSWNTTLVRQPDGIVVLEAPISSGYSEKVIAEARRRFPGVPIKAVITTSDSWPHIAGIRQYVAAGIPIFALDLNKPILSRLIEGPRTSKQDDLSRTPRKAEVRLINSRKVLGNGANRIEIFPIRGETSERQMMIYFPEHHLLYGSDPFQRRRDGSFFYPQTVSELIAAVARERLDVTTFFMMHIGPTPWSELSKAVATALSEDTPNGRP